MSTVVVSQGAERRGRVKDKVIIVTGAARGQGSAEASALAEEGATVVAVDVVDPVDLAPSIQFKHVDIAEPGDWDDLMRWVQSTYGRVNALVNNAGITWRARLHEVELADWDRVLRVNLTSALIGMQKVSPLMPPGGSIVNICSLAALTGHFTVAYTVSKWGLRGLSRVASLELGSRGIRVNAVFPGHIDTPMLSGAPAHLAELSIGQIPLGRIGNPADLAPLIVFLVSDESSWISGAEIVVDGGQNSHGGMKVISDESGKAP